MSLKKVIPTILAMSMLANTSYLVTSFAADTPSVFAESDSQNITQTRYTSTGSLTAKNKSKVTLNTTYIKDKYSNQDTAIITLKGFIPSGRTIKKESDNVATMKWPYSYLVKVESFCDDDTVKITESLPDNTIASKEVSQTVTYSLGGGLDVDSTGLPSGGLNASSEFSKTIEYTQPDYITIKTDDTNTVAGWNIQFAETRAGYNVNSWNLLYGNEMFLRTRYGNVSSDQNFLEDYKLSSLITGGFSPNMGLVLKGDKASGLNPGARKSLLKVTFERVPNYYTIQWSTQWWGENAGAYKIKDPNNFGTFLFELDWQNCTIKPIEIK